MPADEFPAFLVKLSKVFGHRVRKYGNTPTGVLWKDHDGQHLRFEVLCGILAEASYSTPLTISDFGCGYGAFFDFLTTVNSLPPFQYTGYDISGDMIERARRRLDDPRVDFHIADRPLRSADYTFVSGTYNLHVDVDNAIWNGFIKSSLSQLWAKTDQGLAFNMLDKNHRNRLNGLYYADRDDFLEFCARLSPNVTLIDDYPLDEWTIFIRR